MADNSAFISFENKKVTLAIADGLAHLASDKAQERLTSELSRYLSHDITLTIQQESQGSTATLANERAEQKRSSQQQAIDSIHNDPVVDAIKQTFDARIIESTIKPLN